MIRRRRRNGNAWLAALESGQISPGTVESEISRLKIQLEDEVGLGYPEERVEKTRASLRDAEEALKTGTQKWESVARKRLMGEPEHAEPSAIVLAPAGPRTEKDEAREELDRAKKQLASLRRELKLAIEYGDPDDVLTKIRSDINAQITAVSDAEWDLARARDVPVRAPAPPVLAPRSAPQEPSEDQVHAARERAEAARRVASARAGLADVNRQIRMLERDLDEAERFGSPEEAAEIQAKLVALHAEAAGFEATLRAKNPRRRNSDLDLRALERAFMAAPTDELARDRFLAGMLRAGRLTDAERIRVETLLARRQPEEGGIWSDHMDAWGKAREIDLQEIALDLLDKPFEKFVSWERIYELLQSGPSNDRQTIEDACLGWAEQALPHEAPGLIANFEHRHGVKLTKAQREAVETLCEDVLRDGCHEAFREDLRKVVRSAADLVDRAASSDMCESAFEARALPPPDQISGLRSKPVRAWREGESEGGESGVWFSLSRTFVRAYAEAAYCAADYHPEAAMAHPGEFCLAKFDGDDVIVTARRWADCVGDTFRMPSNGADPSLYADTPKDSDIMAAARGVGPLRKKRS